MPVNTEDQTQLANGSSNVNGTTLATTTTKPSKSQQLPTPSYKLPKVDTNLVWPEPIGAKPRGPTDDNIIVFRRAVGINSDLDAFKTSSKAPGTLEEGCKHASGIYRSVLEEGKRRQWQYRALSLMLNVSHFAQIIIGATLTALGPNAGRYALVITALGAVNTIFAGVLALLKGQGLPERLHKDVIEYRKLQDWIEETEALLATGIIGRDRKEVGILVESAFKKYNSAKASKENNRPENYVLDISGGNYLTKSSDRSDGAGLSDKK